MAWTHTRRTMPLSGVSTSGASELVRGAAAPPAPVVDRPDLQTLYRAHFAFVWRSLRRLGVAPAGIDDAVHDVFVVVHKRLPDFEPGAPERPWLFGITRRIAQHARRKHWREQLAASDDANPTASLTLDPQAAALQAETARLLQRCLDTLDEDKRCVLILADLEQMSGPAIASALDANLNTVYARLRAARQQFSQAWKRERARADRGGDG
jgi:RNA polymerase sigma-70 factor (ECF subfamily)